MPTGSTSTKHGIRSPMNGFTPPIKTPNVHPAGGGTIIPHSVKSVPIQSPQNGKGCVK